MRDSLVLMGGFATLTLRFISMGLARRSRDRSVGFSMPPRASAQGQELKICVEMNRSVM